MASLGEGREHVTFFGVEDRKLDRGAPDHASDALSCLCGERLEYSVAFFGHVGHWRCPSCQRTRPKPEVAARLINLKDGRNARFQLAVGDEHKGMVDLGIGGLYNVYNALASAAGARALGLPASASIEAIEGVAAAFGRQEAFEVDGRRVEVFLGKNPAGLNQVLSTLLLDASRRTALFVLNDGIADGRDISWVWDADFEMAADKLAHVVTSGTRAAEMALRLKYAEWDEKTMRGRPADRACAGARHRADGAGRLPDGGADLHGDADGARAAGEAVRQGAVLEISSTRASQPTTTRPVAGCCGWGICIRR